MKFTKIKTCFRCGAYLTEDEKVICLSCFSIELEAQELVTKVIDKFWELDLDSIFEGRKVWL